LEVKDIDDGTLEVLFSRQIERSPQCTKLYGKYEDETQELVYERSYEKLRKMVDTHLALQARKKQRKLAQQRTGTGLAGDGGFSGKGVCPQWKSKGACSRGTDCAFTHPKDQKGTGKGKKGKDKKKKGGSRNPSHDSRASSQGGGHTPQYTPRGKQGKGKGKGRGKGKDRKKSASPSASSERRRSGTPPVRKPKCRAFEKGKCKYTKETCKYGHPPLCKHFASKEGCSRKAEDCWYSHYKKSGTATPATSPSPKKKKGKKKSQSPTKSQSPKGSDKPKKKSRSQRRAASRRRAAEGCVAIGGYVLASAIVGIGNALSLCTDSIAMKLENCTPYAPGFDYCYANVDYCTTVPDYECVIKQSTYDTFPSGSDGKTLPTVYKHSINQNVCTYDADSSAYACSEY